MSRKRFSDADKAKALRLLEEGQSQEKVAKKIKCSVFSLQDWKKKAKAAADAPATEKKKASPKPVNADNTPVPTIAAETAESSAKALERRILSKDNLWADLFLEPRDFSAEEVVKIIKRVVREAVK